MNGFSLSPGFSYSPVQPQTRSRMAPPSHEFQGLHGSLDVALPMSGSLPGPPQGLPQIYLQDASTKAQELVDAFGQPDIQSPELLIWTRPVIPHVYRLSLDLKDQTVLKFPRRHHTFIEFAVIVPIPTDKINNVLSMSPDLSYDRGHQTLRIRGMSIGYNLALLSLVLQYIRERYSWYQIKNRGYVKLWTSPNHIGGSAVDPLTHKPHSQEIEASMNDIYSKIKI